MMARGTPAPRMIIFRPAQPIGHHLKTAQAHGLTVPGLLVRAEPTDQVSLATSAAGPSVGVVQLYIGSQGWTGSLHPSAKPTHDPKRPCGRSANRRTTRLH